MLCHQVEEGGAGREKGQIVGFPVVETVGAGVIKQLDVSDGRGTETECRRRGDSGNEGDKTGRAITCQRIGWKIRVHSMAIKTRNKKFRNQLRKPGRTAEREFGR